MKTDAIPTLLTPTFLTAQAGNWLLISALLIIFVVVSLFLMQGRIKTAVALLQIASSIKKNNISLRQAAYSITNKTRKRCELTAVAGADDIRLITSLKYMKDYQVEPRQLTQCITRLTVRVLFGKY
ncbi:MAG: hypothetical protein OEY36_07555 [Gammaproteobacteria bacterium]|nr:hypothetical protein [Gammaproteobacteria bacterium]